MAPSDVSKRFEALGWVIQSGAKHSFAVLGTKKIRMPNPHRGDVSVGLISRIIRDADIDRSDWLG